MFTYEKCFFSCVCRSPIQNHEQFEAVCSDFNNLLNKSNNNQSTCSVIVGDCNAKWYPGDNNNTGGLEIDTFRTAAGYTQLIKKPTLFVNSSLPPLIRRMKV